VSAVRTREQFSFLAATKSLYSLYITWLEMLRYNWHPNVHLFSAIRLRKLFNFGELSSPTYAQYRDSEQLTACIRNLLTIPTRAILADSLQSPTSIPPTVVAVLIVVCIGLLHIVSYRGQQRTWTFKRFYDLPSTFWPWSRNAYQPSCGQPSKQVHSERLEVAITNRNFW